MHPITHVLQILWDDDDRAPRRRRAPRKGSQTVNRQSGWPAGSSTTTIAMAMFFFFFCWPRSHLLQLRRELMSWEVDQWAHINPGSIYSSLSTLTKQGHLRRHDLAEGSREVAVYTSTDSGRAELDELFGRALETVELLDALPLHTALSMCTLFDRATVEGHLARRADALAVHLEVLAGKVGGRARRRAAARRPRRRAAAGHRRGGAGLGARPGRGDPVRWPGVRGGADGLAAGARRPGLADGRRPGPLPPAAAPLTHPWRAAVPRPVPSR